MPASSRVRGADLLPAQRHRPGMTSRATFGDFAARADRHLDQLPRPAIHRPGAAANGDAAQIAGSVRAAIRPLAGYAADISAVFDAVPRRLAHGHAPWIRAATRTREALDCAAAFLEPSPGPGQSQQTRPRSQTAAALQSAAEAMPAGRDLLHTPAISRDDGTWQPFSEWAPVITSIPIARALLHQVAAWAGKIAPHGSQAALTTMSGTTGERRAVNGACQWLRVLQWAVAAAGAQQSFPAADLGLLHAIPVNTPIPRHVPDGGEPVTALCHGITAAAERARTAATAAAPQATWSPALPTRSLRHVPGHCTLTSWGCHL